MNPTTIFPAYQPAQNSADFLLQAHCAVIEELLEATFEVERVRAGYLCDLCDLPWWAGSPLKARLAKAQRAYYFVSRLAV